MPLLPSAFGVGIEGPPEPGGPFGVGQNPRTGRIFDVPNRRPPRPGSALSPPLEFPTIAPGTPQPIPGAGDLLSLLQTFALAGRPGAVPFGTGPARSGPLPIPTFVQGATGGTGPQIAISPFPGPATMNAMARLGSAAPEVSSARPFGG